MDMFKTSEKWLIWLLLAAISFAVFGQSINDQFHMLDDPYLVVNNLAAHGPTPANLVTAFTSYDPELYIPLTLLSYQLNYLVGGLNPIVYHATNIILHSIVALFFIFIASKILKDRTVGVLVGILFAVHPLNTEAVAWIAGRKDLLSSVFLLWSLNEYFKCRESSRRQNFYMSIALYVLSALSKGSVFTFPLLLPLLDFLRSPKEYWLKATWRTLVPFIVIAGITGVIALFGKTQVVESSSMQETLIMAAKSTVFYLQKIVLPTDLSVIYPYQRAITLASPDFWMPIVVLSLIVLLAALVLRWTRMPIITLLLFLITISPSYFNFHKGTLYFFAVDRYTYVGMMWILLFVGVLAKGLRERRKILSVLGVLSIAAGVASWRQTAYWKNDETLFQHVLSLYPESISARLSLSVWYRESGRFSDERKIIEDGLMHSRDTALLLALGSVEERARNTDTAIKLFEEAKTMDPLNPEPLFFLGSLDEKEGKVEEAKAKYRLAAKLDPSYVAALVNLGAILFEQRQLQEAEEVLKQATKWNPNALEAHMNLYQVLEMLRRSEEAFPHLVASYKLDNKNPDILLMYAYKLSERKENKKAIKILRELLTIDPQNRTGNRLMKQLDPSWEVHTPSDFRSKEGITL